MANKHKCPGCPKEFQSLNDLKKHCLKYHGFKLGDTNQHEQTTIGDIVGRK